MTLRGESARLYRAVSDAELEDILRFGFRPGAGSMETKLFTSSAEDAAFFAQHILFPLGQKLLTIVEVEIPDSLRSRLFHFTTDGKTTIAVEHHLLAEFNAAVGIHLMYFAPLPIP